ncbi:MAG TPA: glycoside hydrolase family 2 TIM barrel-domain containing protein [Prolixibacteraceae bacterium]|nr:glycoside hydrolase family 2 TIM barrel-domain containing protein [Prolixibacteraceae bacterium]
MRTIYSIIQTGAFLSLFLPLSAGEPLINNVEGRNINTLNGVWKYIVDPYELGFYDYRRQQRDLSDRPGGSEAFFTNSKPQHPSDRVEYDFDKSDNILVPRDWNSQKEKLFYYEGTIWYYKKFNLKAQPGKRYFLHFGAANYEAHVYLNGKKLGAHIGGFTPFNFEITGKVNDENFVVVKVDNARGLEKVPTVNTDWWNYGGLTRDVSLVEVPETFIRDYSLRLNPENPDRLDVRFVLDGSDRADKVVEIRIPEAGIAQTFQTREDGTAVGSFDGKSIGRWSPENPRLYTVEIINGDEKVSERIGFRTIETKENEILLNGKPVFLRGICIHEENGIRGGRAYSREDAQMLLGWAKELGCNFVRLAHYPHNENMTRVADEMGIMVWSEVPVYWTIQWKNEATFLNAQNQVTEMVSRDKNRASVVIWSMANETPVSPERTAFLRKLIETTRTLDPSRLISAAMERHTKAGTQNVQVIEDPLQEYVDIISFNQYIGWYDGTPDKCDRMEFEINYNKPVLISEFGGGALQGYHGSTEQLWTEEYQEYLYRKPLSMLERIPQLRGTTPWILADFRSPRRVLPDIQDGWNRKGLISETGNRKKAFWVLNEWYREKTKEYSSK